MLAALGVTIAAAGIELFGARAGHSLFLTADAFHLVAHIGIFAVLLLRPGRSHATREDLTTLCVIALVMFVSFGLTWSSLRGLRHPQPIHPSAMVLSLFGFGANLATAALFRDPARLRWSFRAALAHELADASLTIAGLAGAGAIALFSWLWVDPGLSLLIAVWLLLWCLRLVLRRIRLGPEAWRLGENAAHQAP